MKINKLMSWLLACATVAGVTSCGSGSSDDYWSKFDALPVQESENGNWSFYQPDGTLLYVDEFKTCPTAIINGYFVVKEGDGYTLYRADKKPEVVGDLEDLKAVGAFFEGDLVPVVRPKERISVVNKKGETVFTLDPYKGKEIVRCDVAFQDGLLIVELENGLTGYVDTKGEMVIEPKYKGASGFKYGRTVVKKDNEDATQVVIDKSGEPLFNLRKGQTVLNVTLSEQYILVSDANDRLLFLDTKGETVFKCPAKVKSVGDIKGDKLTFSNENGEWGLMDLEGETLIRPKYNSITFIDGNKLLAETEDYAVVINYEGEESLRMEDYKRVSWIGKYGFLARERNDYVFLDKDGKPVKNSEFENIDGPPFMYTCSPITSDYFNMDAAVTAIVELVKDNGVGNYTFGTSPRDVFRGSDPQKYSYDYKAELKDLAKEGFKYTLNVKAGFDGYIARYNYGYYYSGAYEWADGILNGFEININTDTEWGNGGSEALLGAFERNGYHLLKRTSKNNDDFAATLKKGNTLLVITSQKGSSSGLVYVFKYTSELEETFSSAIASKENEDNEVSVEAVEAVADAVADSVYAYSAE